MIRDYLAIAEEYAQGVECGAILSCWQVRKMVERQRQDIARQKDEHDFLYTWMPEYRAIRACTFIERFKHYKGKWAGTLFVMEPWEVYLTVVLFGWVSEPTMARRFREFFLLVPRKNGKTFYAAGLGLFGLIADEEPGAEVYCGANGRDQADLLFSAAKTMLKNNTPIKTHIGAEIQASSILVPKTASKFEPEIKNVRDGANPHFAICDEIHEADNSVMIDAFSTGFGAREQPLLILISTAGINLSGPCYERQQGLENVLNGTLSDDRLFGTVYTIDKDDKWEDINSWIKANPNYGVSVSEEFVQVKLNAARQYINQRNMILCKNLNVWMNAGVAWTDMVAWEECFDNNLKIEDFKGKQCYLGLDLASKIDMVALVVVFPIENGFAVFGKYYLPSETVNSPQNHHYQTWEMEGLLTVTDGARVDFGIIADDIRLFSNIFNVKSLAYDPNEAGYFIQDVEIWANFECIDIAQSPKLISEPMKELEALIAERELKHDGNKILTWMMSNVVRKKAKGSGDVKYYYPTKERASQKIDGAVALIMAISRAMLHEPDQTGNDGSLI